MAETQLEMYKLYPENMRRYLGSNLPEFACKHATILQTNANEKPHVES